MVGNTIIPRRENQGLEMRCLKNKNLPEVMLIEGGDYGII